MCFVSKFVFYFLLTVLPFLLNFSLSTIDVNSAEYQYIADHLTEKECRTLAAALHFHSFEIPEENDIAESKLPEKISCIDLLLHWNSAPKEGKGKTHIEICHRLNQMGRQDLAQWLSKTVFHEVGKNLKVETASKEIQDEMLSLPHVTQATTENIDEAAWTVMDSVLSILIILGLIILIFGSSFFCFLRCTRTFDDAHKGYKKLPASEKLSNK